MPNPGAILVGAILGLGLGVIGAIPLLAVGWDATTAAGQIALILVGIAAQFVAGYTAARIGRRHHEIQGGLAALLLFGAVAVIALAAAGDPSLTTLTLGGAMALVMGTLGGLLARGLVE